MMGKKYGPMANTRIQLFKKLDADKDGEVPMDAMFASKIKELWPALDSETVIPRVLAEFARLGGSRETLTSRRELRSRLN